MALTYTDILQYLRDNDRNAQGARHDRAYLRIANDACRALHGAGEWSFDRSRHRLTFAAYKTAGTVSVAAGGTAVTGVGTAFATPGDVGKYLRFNGEPQQYLVSAAPSALALTIETYQGETALAGVSYQLTQDRLALPTRVRRIFAPFLSSVQGRLELTELEWLQYERLHGRETGTPRCYAVETAQTVAGGGGLVGSGYLWIYPAPQVQEILEFTCFLWPTEITSGTDGISAPLQAESAYREFLLAYLFRDQEDTEKWERQFAAALACARRDLAQFRPAPIAGQRAMWTPDGDSADRPRRILTDENGRR